MAKKDWKIYGANVVSPPNSCFYCTCEIDSFSGTVDHLIPESRGGIRANKNKVRSCGDCNKLKGDMTPEEFKRALKAMMRLKTKEHGRQIGYLKKVLKNVDKLIDSKENGNRKADTLKDKRQET